MHVLAILFYISLWPGVYLLFKLLYIVTYRPTARQQLSIHGSSKHATMGAVFSVKLCYSSLLGSTTILAREGSVVYVIHAVSI
jgi:hypothetical protein